MDSLPPCLAIAPGADGMLNGPLLLRCPLDRPVVPVKGKTNTVPSCAGGSRPLNPRARLRSRPTKPASWSALNDCRALLGIFLQQPEYLLSSQEIAMLPGLGQTAGIGDENIARL